ncbi:ABC transporter ATP-binding protein [Nocardioides dokdonensis]|uniref:ABC transporter ATP-binding protein n=1 Tax=Nocardioides dokdonensis TaxID=450734 RepID=UPI000ACCC5B1|nr:ABC transporter ATP-binding protein [Nocardioides dokdonensis]
MDHPQRHPPAIELVGLSKSFGRVQAVDGVDLEIADGEFFSMLGPSGSGKTTVLRLIAGFERPSAGTIRLAGSDATGAAPFERPVNTVFQDYALFPHMSILENVAYGLRVRGVGKAERRSSARDALDTVQLGHLADRRPSQLSGGQRQRIALARAIVVRPKVLLLDEPLGALDLKLREQMQVELKALQRELGITFVFVTHDQEEALTLSDRIAVFNEGRIVQLGTPREIYEEPQSEYVATFVGTSNVLDEPAARSLLGREGRFALRPEKIHIAGPAPQHAVSVRGVVVETIYLGTGRRVVVDADDGIRLVVLEAGTTPTTSSAATRSRRGGDRRTSCRSRRRPAPPAPGPDPAPRSPAPTPEPRTHEEGRTRDEADHPPAAPERPGHRRPGLQRGPDRLRQRRRDQHHGRRRARRDGGRGLDPGLARLRRGRQQRPGRRLGQLVRGGDGVPGDQQGLRHLRRGVQPDEDR